MKRAFWFAAGAGAGVYAMTKARRVAEIFTPEGLADHLAGLSLGLRLFGDEVRAGMVEKENDVRQRLGVRLPEGPSRPAELEAGDGEANPAGTVGTAMTSTTTMTTREGTH
jgi:Family of unknown function (DUF6167)